MDEAPPALPPAGFWLRVGAFSLDYLLLLVPMLVLRLNISPSVPSSMLGVPAMLLYFAVLPSEWGGRTPGKALAGIKVVGLDGGPAGLGRFVLRFVGYAVSALPASLGYLLAAFTPEKRALHDYIAGTRVVREREVGALRLIPLALAVPMTVLAMAIPTLYRLGTAPREVSERTVEAEPVPARPAQAGQTASEDLERKRVGIEKAVAGGLFQLRSGLDLYKKAHGGSLPQDLAALAVPGIITQLPTTASEAHEAGDGWVPYGPEACPEGFISGAGLRDSGRWAYVSDVDASCAGKVFLDCTHVGPHGRPWYEQ